MEIQYGDGKNQPPLHGKHVIRHRPAQTTPCLFLSAASSLALPRCWRSPRAAPQCRGATGNPHPHPLPPRLHLFREFMPGEVEREIGDPFGGPLALYEVVRDEMVESIPSLVRHLRSLAG